MEKIYLITFLLITTTSMVYQTQAHEDEEIVPMSSLAFEPTPAYLVYDQSLAQEEDEIIPVSSLVYEPTPAYEYDHELIQHMPTQRIEFLKHCSDKMSSKCAVEMTKGLINHKSVSEECCGNFLKIGRACHQGLMNFVFATYELKYFANEILPRSKRMWNNCVQITAAKIGAPIAFET